MKHELQREMIIKKFKETGLRVTRQRLILIDIVLENEFSSCKEIFYKAAEYDNKIGSATVYRMINVLEQIGAISKKNMYRVREAGDGTDNAACIVMLDDNTKYHLSSENWNLIVQAGLSAYGYIDEQKVTAIETR